jgi:hypothetical protein
MKKIFRGFVFLLVLISLNACVGTARQTPDNMTSIVDVHLSGSNVNAENWVSVWIKFDRLTKVETYWTPEGLLKNFHDGIETQVMDQGRTEENTGLAHNISIDLNVVKEKMGSLEKPFRFIMGTVDPIWGPNIVDVRIAKRENIPNDELQKYPGATFLRMTLMTTMGGWEPKTKNLDPIM